MNHNILIDPQMVQWIISVGVVYREYMQKNSSVGPFIIKELPNVISEHCKDTDRYIHAHPLTVEKYQSQLP